MMITLRSVAAFIFSAVLTGCFANQCPRPGYPSATGHFPCYYKLKVDTINPTTGYVTATYGADPYSEPDEISKETFTFRVRDLDKVKLKKGDVRVFSNGIGSPTLEVFEEDADFPKETQEASPVLKGLRHAIP